MKKYVLNPKEELLLECKPDTLSQARKNNRAILIGTIFLILLSLFFLYVMKSIPSFYPLLVLIGLIAVAGVIYYINGLIRGAKGSDLTYCITNIRVVIVDSDNNIRKEVYLNDIRKINLDKVTGKLYDVVINPKEETNPTKLRRHFSNRPLYTADTVILEAVDGQKVKELLGK